MRIINDIIWLEYVVEKLIWKHSVSPVEVEEALCGKCRIFKKEKGRVDGEHLYNALGRTRAGRYLSIFFILKFGKRALVITARDMNERERKLYGKK